MQPSDDVIRYAPEDGNLVGALMRISPSGTWVRFEDHDRIVSSLRERLESLEGSYYAMKLTRTVALKERDHARERRDHFKAQAEDYIERLDGAERECDLLVEQRDKAEQRAEALEKGLREARGTIARWAERHRAEADAETGATAGEHLAAAEAFEDAGRYILTALDTEDSPDKGKRGDADAHAPRHSGRDGRHVAEGASGAVDPDAPSEISDEATLASSPLGEFLRCENHGVMQRCAAMKDDELGDFLSCPVHMSDGGRCDKMLQALPTQRPVIPDRDRAHLKYVAELIERHLNKRDARFLRELADRSVPTQQPVPSDKTRERLREIARQIEYAIEDADWPEFPEGDPADPMIHVRFLRSLAEGKAETCEECGGSGSEGSFGPPRVLMPAYPCSACNGSGIAPQYRDGVGSCICARCLAARPEQGPHPPAGIEPSEPHPLRDEGEQDADH